MRSVSMVLAGFGVMVAACGGSGGGPTLSVTVPTNPIPSGTSVQATASISGSTSLVSDVTWSSTNSNVASVSSSGMITGALAGTAAITARSGSMTGHIDVTVVPGAPVAVLIYAGDGQSGTKGSTLRDPLCTNVKDAAGNKILGITVTYTVTTGSGTLASPTAPQTDSSGIAISGLWTLGPNAGEQTVTASVPGATSVTFTATAR
jgi:hypothetical protein